LGDDVVEIWNFNLDEGEKILATASAYKGEHSTHIPLVDNGKVIFKNVDFTNLAILTSKNATSMSLYILNGMTGQVHFNEYRAGLNLNHPVNLAYD
jgi:outer membrane protein assembly factor BamB